MAGVIWGAVIIGISLVAYRSRRRLQAFAAGMHSDIYATVGTWGFIVFLFALGLWAMVAGAWSILD